MKIHLPSPRQFSRRSSTVSGFTLLEVMIACFVFFLVAFSVLQMTTVSIVAAKSLQRNTVDVGLLAAEVTATNKIYEEGPHSVDYQDLYPDYLWEYNVRQYASNGLYEVEFVVTPKSGGPASATRIKTLVYSKDSPPGVGFGGIKP